MLYAFSAEIGILYDIGLFPAEIAGLGWKLVEKVYK